MDITLEDCRKAIKLFIEVLCDYQGRDESCIDAMERMYAQEDSIEYIYNRHSITFTYGDDIYIKLAREQLNEDSFYLRHIEMDKEIFLRLQEATDRKFRENGLKLCL